MFTYVWEHVVPFVFFASSLILLNISTVPTPWFVQQVIMILLSIFSHLLARCTFYHNNQRSTICLIRMIQFRFHSNFIWTISKHHNEITTNWKLILVNFCSPVEYFSAIFEKKLLSNENMCENCVWTVCVFSRRQSMPECVYMSWVQT